MNITRKKISIGLISLTGAVALAACGYVKVFDGSGSQRLTWTAENGYETGTDAGDLAACTAALDETDLTFGTGDTAAGVTTNFTLPSTISGCSLSWSANTAAAAWISISGTTATVTRQYGTTDGAVTLTATITAGAASGTKDLAITILRQVPDSEAVATCVANFPASPFTFGTAGDTTSDINGTFTASTTQNDCAVAWSKSNELSWVSIFGGSFTVTRQQSATNQTGTLIATISRNNDTGASDSSKTYSVTVKRLLQNSEVDACAAAISSSDITFASGDTAGGVTSSFTFPSTKSMGSYSCSVTWSEVTDTSNAIAIASGLSATITRPSYTAGNASVTVKATATSGDYTKDSSNVTFTVTKLAVTDSEAVSYCKTALTTADFTGITVTGATTGTVTTATTAITLPTSKTTSGITCSIGWASGNASYLSVSGGNGTAIHEHDATDTDVILTPTITYGTTTDSTKTFTIKVKSKFSVSNKSVIVSAVVSPPAIEVYVRPAADFDGHNITYTVCISQTESHLTSIAAMDGAGPVCQSTSTTNDFLSFSNPGSGVWRGNIYAKVDGEPSQDSKKILYDGSGTAGI